MTTITEQELDQVEEFLNRGHVLTIDSGWRAVADAALALVQRVTAATP